MPCEPDLRILHWGANASASPGFFPASAGYDVQTSRSVIGDCTAVFNRFARQCWWSGLLVELTTMAVEVEAMLTELKATVALP